MLQVKGKRKTPSIAFAERVITKKVSQWRPFTPCKGARRFKSEAYGAWMHDPQFAHTREWTVLAEPEGIGTCCEKDTFQYEAAMAVVANRGARVSGRGGVGKTELIRLLVKLFSENGYKDRIEIMASTHLQAQCADGKTILSHLHKNSGCKERVLIIDELSMVSLAIWPYLAEAAFVGCVTHCRARR